MNQTELDPLAWQYTEKILPGGIRGRAYLDIPGSVLVSKIWGSFSHDTQLPGSDIDYTGVYVASPQRFLGLHPPADTLTGENPDYQVHEVKKFCDLLLKGNPGVIEMLFTYKMFWCDPRFVSMISNLIL